MLSLSALERIEQRQCSDALQSAELWQGMPCSNPFDAKYEQFMSLQTIKGSHISGNR